MITIIVGTNRTGTEANKFAAIYEEYFKEKGEEVQLFSLENLPEDMIHNDMFSKEGISEALKNIQDTYLKAAEKWLFVIPEYNGGVPGILKLWIDAMSVRDMKETFKGKKVCLTGISSGRAGNLRGMEHFTGILNFLQAIVHPNRLPISRIHTLMKGGEIVDKVTVMIMKEQAAEFLDF